MSSARSGWPIRRFALGAEPPDDVPHLTTPTERLAVMWRMAPEGWALAGRTLPAYQRSEMPVRRCRLEEVRDEE